MILQKEEKVLRQKAKEVPIGEITSPKIKKIISDMKKALAEQTDGVGLAAPQIGVSFQIFIVSGKIFESKTVAEKSPGRGRSSDSADDSAESPLGLIRAVSIEARLEVRPRGGDLKHDSKYPDLVFINPKITKLSKKKVNVPEGCLSVRWLYGDVKRSSNATIEAYDENGKKITRGAGGLLAQIFQHETDHLNGVLFIDKARNLQEIPPESVNKASKQVK